MLQTEVLTKIICFNNVRKNQRKETKFLSRQYNFLIKDGGLSRSKS